MRRQKKKNRTGGQPPTGEGTSQVAPSIRHVAPCCGTLRALKKKRKKEETEMVDAQL